MFEGIAPELIQNGTNKVNKVAEKKIALAISLGGKEIEKLASIILKKATEQLYKTLFCLLGEFGCMKTNLVLRKLQKIKRKVQAKNKPRRIARWFIKLCYLWVY